MAFANLRTQTERQEPARVRPPPPLRPPPPVGDPGSLHEAGHVGLLEQLLRVDHQACMLQQASLPRELSGEGLFFPGAGALQGRGQSALPLRYGRPQLSDTVGEVADHRGAVGLEGVQDEDPKRGQNTHESLHYSNRPLEGRRGSVHRNSPPFA